MAYSGAYQPPPEAISPAKPAIAPHRPFFSAPPGKAHAGLAALMKKMKAIDLDGDDLLMLLMLYLMYRESGERELLILMGAMLLG